MSREISRKYSELHIPLPPAATSSSFFLFFFFFSLHQRVTKGTISVTLRESSRERSRSFFRESFQRLEYTVERVTGKKKEETRVAANRARHDHFFQIRSSSFESKTNENIARALNRFGLLRLLEKRSSNPCTRVEIDRDLSLRP